MSCHAYELATSGGLFEAHFALKYTNIGEIKWGSKYLQCATGCVECTALYIYNIGQAGRPAPRASSKILSISA